MMTPSYRERAQREMPEFEREQRLLDLAIKVHAGTATTDECCAAADALSLAVGERLRLEMKVVALESALAFFMRVMKLVKDNGLEEEFHWRVSNKGLPVEFFLGAPADVDGVGITPENLHLLEAALQEVRAADHHAELFWGSTLFVCRMRNEPVNPRLIDYAPQALRPLLLAVGS